MRKISEVFINGVCLEEILEDHKRWLNNNGGKRANLMGVDLNCVDLSDINLKKANLTDTNLRCANLTDINLNGANLELANLSRANLKNANLRNSNLNSSDLMGADLTDADLSSADLSVANLRDADLRSTCLRGANLNYIDLRGSVLKGTDLRNADLSYDILRDADLKYADLRGANLNKVLYNHQTSFFSLACPEEGSFIGYKKADDKIVKLLITEDSKRSSATTRKCRCSKAKVLSITNIENTEEYNEVVSNYDNNFIYRVGETVEVENFDDDRWNECSNGIHFFITRDEAVIY